MNLRRELMRERFKGQIAEAASKAKLFFMVQETGEEIPAGFTEPTISFSIETCHAADLDDMSKEYEFVRMGGNGNLPVFKRRK
jgi:hypothetical protein